MYFLFNPSNKKFSFFFVYKIHVKRYALVHMLHKPSPRLVPKLNKNVGRSNICPCLLMTPPPFFLFSDIKSSILSDITKWLKKNEEMLQRVWSGNVFLLLPTSECENSLNDLIGRVMSVIKMEYVLQVVQNTICIQ